MEKWLRLEEVANRLGVSYSHVRKIVLIEKSLPHLRVGRGIRVKEGDLEKYIQELVEKSQPRNT